MSVISQVKRVQIMKVKELCLLHKIKLILKEFCILCPVKDT